MGVGLRLRPMVRDRGSGRDDEHGLFELGFFAGGAEAGAGPACAGLLGCAFLGTAHHGRAQLYPGAGAAGAAGIAVA